METQNTSFKEIRLRAPNMLTIGSIVNIVGGPIWPLREHKNLHLDNKTNIHKSFEDYEANGYKHDLDLLIISS